MKTYLGKWSKEIGQKVSKLQQYEAVIQKTVKFTASFLVFWIGLVSEAEPLWQK